MTTATVPITTQTHPVRDTVLYDGQCRFCRAQIALLRRLDITGRLQFMSLHDPGVARDFPEIPRDDLLAEMFIVYRQGHTYRGAGAVRYLSRVLVALWPLALPLHVPGSMPLWRWLYGIVARNRYRIAGTCDEGTCRIP